MGQMKRAMEEAESRGFYSLPVEHVCDECFDDPPLAAFVRENAESKRCGYCGRTADTPIAAATDSVMEEIVDGIAFEYVRAIDELPWDGGEGGWQGATIWDTWDLFDHFGWPFRNEQLGHDAIEGIGLQDWCSRHYAEATTGELLDLSWSRLVEVLSHQRRYLFEMGGERSSEGLDLLRALCGLITEHDLLRELPAGTTFARVRVHDRRDAVASAQDLGTPPATRARTNRMSAAGIPLFYGAHDAETAVVETVDPADAGTSVVTLGRFELTAPLLAVDMTALPSLPSIFDRERRDARDALAFLNGFARDISKPVRRDGSEHIDYVPTQVVCEYLRHEFPAKDGRRPQGVLFRSSALPNGTVAALFVDRVDCVDPGQEDASGRPQLVLREKARVDVDVHVSIRRLHEL